MGEKSHRYRHQTPHQPAYHSRAFYVRIQDKDLDHNIYPIVTQRRYGDPDRETSRNNNNQYNKPIILRPGCNTKLSVGNHVIDRMDNLKYSQVTFDGSHWANADPCFCVARRIQGSKLRQSKSNLKFCLTAHNHHITEEQIINECNSHLNDPQLF